LFASGLSSQDAMFSILSLDDTYLNPANTFNPFYNNSTLKFDLQFRDQWNSVSNGDTYATAKVHGEYNLYLSQYDAWNVGLFWLSDRSSGKGHKNSNLQLLASYTRKLSETRGNKYSHFITMGAGMSFAQTNADLENIWFGRQFNLNSNFIDRTLTSGEEFRIDNHSYSSIDGGLRWMYLLENDNYYMAGLSIAHLNNPSIESTNANFSISPRLLFQAEAHLDLSEGFNHIPGLVLINHGPFWQISPSYGLSIDIYNDDNSLSLISGVSARLINSVNGIMMDAIIFNLGLQSNTWSFNFNFDLNSSALKTYTNNNGAIELALSYSINRD